MKKSILSLLLLLTVFSSYAQSVNTRIISQSENSLTINYQFTSYTLEKHLVFGETTYIPLIDEGTLLLEQGSPEVSKFTTAIQTPKDSELNIEVIHEDFIDIEDVVITPSKGNLYRNEDPNMVDYEFGSKYTINSLFPRERYKINEEYNIRNVSGRSIWVYPFRANPVEKSLRVYKELTLKITFDKLFDSSTKNVDPAFKTLYQDHFLNFEALKYDPVSEQGKMLIISHADFIEAMEPFSNWKTQIGIENEIIDIAEIGANATDIKSFIQEYYDENGLTYVLLVGDHQQIPADNLAAGYSDNSYTYVAGDDHYPDLFIGRFSAESVEHAETMVNRSMSYEQAPFSSNNYKNAVSIGSEDATSSTDPSSGNTGMGDDNEADWHHLMNINTDLLGFTYTNVLELYEGGPYPGSNDAPGYPNNTELLEAINDGVGLINYTGHGSSEEFVTTGFNNTDIDNLTNTETFPFIFSVACVNGEFMNTTCFAEKWLRATDDNDNPTGAVAVIMSTINQSWNPPMSGQDEMNDILTEQYSDNIRRSFGAITMQGCMKMNDDYGSGGDEMTDTWTIFGDPSLMVRTDKVGQLTASYEEIIPIGATTLEVSSNYEDAVVALTNNNELLAEGVIINGQVVLNFETITDVDEYTLTITAFNATPYIGSVQSIVLEGPYIIEDQFLLADTLGGVDGQIEAGDSLAFNMSLENVGIETANSLQLVVSSTSPYVMVVNDTIAIDSISAETVLMLNDQIELVLAANLELATNANIGILLFDDAGNQWDLSTVIEFDSAQIEVSEYIINDSEANNNGILDLSETALISFELENIGSAESALILNSLISDNAYLTVYDSTITIESLEAGHSVMVSFECSLSEETPSASEIDFYLNMVVSGDTSIYQYSFITSECGIGDLEVLVAINSDYYAIQETAYMLLDADGGIIDQIEEGEMESEHEYQLEYCFAPGTVIEFVLSDDYGDGLSVGGSYTVTVCDEEIISGGDQDFYSLSEVFVVTCDQESIVWGCTDESACNYNEFATHDDDSCYELNISVSDYSYDNPIVNINTNATGESYQWYLNGSLLNNTANSFSPQENGDYTVVVIDELSCEVSADFSIYSVEVEDLNTVSFTCFPNPNNGQILNIISDKKLELQIVNILGEIVYFEHVEVGNNQINIANLSKGLYLMKTDCGYQERLIIH